MDKEKSNQKIKKMARIVRMVFKITFWISVIAIVVLPLIYVAVQFLPEEYLMSSQFEKGSFYLTLDGLLRYRVPENMTVDISVKPVIDAILLMATVMSVGFAILSRKMIQILKTVESDSPFEMENANRLSALGWLLIIGSFVYQIANAYVAMAMIDTFAIYDLDVVIGVDNAMIITGFILLILSGVFRYGSYLQDEYDSTL
ncbi:MAG: DUF2975 domain-containing protein [Dethiosulfatibacter sp.]|nr:DUF2975 domain-containing protein [Dethiosulfatibacter sp.]